MEENKNMYDEVMQAGEYAKGVVLAVSNSYKQEYYFNEDFEMIPEIVQKELQAMLVWHTVECGGILAIGFNAEGELYIEGYTSEYDGYYDEIGSRLKIKDYFMYRKDLLESLEKFYKEFF